MGTTWLLFLACLGGKIAEAPGFKMSEYFPQDGARNAAWVNEDTNVVERLTGEKAPEAIDKNGVDVYTWSYYYRTDDNLELAYTIDWAAPTGDGVLIYGTSDVDGNQTAYDPPIQVAPITDYMNTGDVITTESGGTWTSEILDVGNCDVEWGALTWEGCVHIRIDDGDDSNDDTDPAFVGDYWQVTTYGTAWFQPSGATTKWVLLDYEWVEPT